MHAYFAKITENNIVENVVVIPDVEAHRGQDYLAIDLALGGVWIQTDPNSREGVRYEPDGVTPSSEPALRHRYAYIGGTYDPDLNAFLFPRPYESWNLDTTTLQWEAPVPRPADGDYVWDEVTLSWVAAS